MTAPRSEQCFSEPSKPLRSVPVLLPRRNRDWPFPHLPASERQPLSVSLWLGRFIIGTPRLDWHWFPLPSPLRQRGRKQNVGKVKWKRTKNIRFPTPSGAKPDSRLMREGPGTLAGSAPLHINIYTQPHNACRLTCKSRCIQAYKHTHTSTALSYVRTGNLTSRRWPTQVFPLMLPQLVPRSEPRGRRRTGLDWQLHHGQLYLDY